MSIDTAIFPIINNEAGLPFLVCGIGVNKNQCHIIRDEGYCIHQVIYCTAGEGVLKIADEQIKIKPNMLYFLPPDIAHEYYQTSKEDFSTNWITFTGENIEATLAKLGMSDWRVFTFDSLENVDFIFRKMLLNYKSEGAASGYVGSAYLYELLVECFKNTVTEKKSLTSQENNIIKPVVNYINEHYKENITLQALATVAKVTPEHLCKVFKASMNMRPFEYLAKKRIQEAKRLISENRYSISQIGAMVGYDNNSYFCSVFKKYENISPSEFRGSTN